ncbi:hypothetical protein CYMTET_36317, partial [Cymbomonas tetramitiformis]
VFTMRLASDLLLNGPNTPLYKALVEPMYGSGYAPASGYGSSRRETSFAVGLKGVAEEDIPKIEQIIKETFEQVARDGFDDEEVQATIHQIELGMREVSPSFGLGVGLTIMPYWIHGGDALSPLSCSSCGIFLAGHLGGSLVFTRTAAGFRLPICAEPEHKLGVGA